MSFIIQHYRVVALGVVCCFTLLGCAQAHYSKADSNPADYPATSVIYLAANVSPALQQARAGQQVVLAQSPWGSDVQLTIAAQYFSAAGRPCINGWVATAEPPAAVVICQYDQRWGVTRALTKLQVQ